jgi:carboxyl-terminal processing protease
VAYLEGQKAARKSFEATRTGALTAAPMVVLVNQGTAGPAELVAGAITDNTRGQIVGTRTFGSGSVQTLIEMENGNALLLATAKYYTPTGKEIESGLRPDVEISAVEEDLVPATLEELEVVPAPQAAPDEDEDRQLKRAIEVLRNPRGSRAAA